jgi:hypothetical protein
LACFRKQDDGTSEDAAASTAAVRDALWDLFQLSTPLAPLVAAWGAADPRLRGIAQSLPGLRVLRQEPVECLVSFVVRSVQLPPPKTRPFESEKLWSFSRVLSIFLSLSLYSPRTPSYTLCPFLLLSWPQFQQQHQPHRLGLEPAPRPLRAPPFDLAALRRRFGIAAAAARFFD